jgi:hypothetical protein
MSSGFFPVSTADYSFGDEREIASRLDKLGKALGLHLVGLSGYRTPQHSVSVGGFPNDPHTRGEASDTPGVEGVSEATLNKYGLTRPFGGAHEADHIQLLAGSASGTASGSGASTASSSSDVGSSGTKFAIGAHTGIGPVDSVIDKVTGGVNTDVNAAIDAVDFAKDPIGWIAAKGAKPLLTIALVFAGLAIAALGVSRMTGLRAPVPGVLP